MASVPEFLGDGEERLWRLIAARGAEGADVERIDQRIWNVFGNDWAIMFTDLAGFSRNVADTGIIDFLQVIHQSRELLLPVADEHDGILLLAEADSFMFLFKRPEYAIRCAQALMQKCAEANAQGLTRGRLRLSAGIGYGRVLRIGPHDVYGSEVNAASKLGEDTAEAEEILVSSSAYELCKDLEEFDFQQTGHIVPGSPQVWRASLNEAS